VMRVQVRVMLSSERVIRNETLEIVLPDGATLVDLLERLPLSPTERKKYLREDGRGLKEGMAILINGENVETLGLGPDTPLEDGCRVSLIYLLAGG